MRAHVRAFLRSTPAAAHWSVAFVLLAWIIKAVWLDDIPAPFSAMVGLAKVSEGILSAYVAGYVFFVVFALLPEYRHRVELGDFLFTKVRHIIGDCSAVMMEIEKASGHGAPFATVTQNQIEAAFRATPAAYQPAMTWNGRQASIFNLLEDRQRRSLEAIQELFEQGRYLDPALVSLLQRVRGHRIESSLNCARAERMTNNYVGDQRQESWGC